MRKKILAVVLTLALAVPMAALAGCSSGTSSSSGSASSASSSGKTTVSIALCQQAMFDGIPQILAEKFPDVEFEFVQANNSADYYKYLAEHNDLPDILTIRRFSLADSVTLKDSLVDVSQSEFAATYYQNYLQNFTYEDGTVNWLPGVAEMWCIAANKTLFEQSNIAIPTDYASFVSACKQFEALGIKGFESDWSYDYTALETLEGFNIDTLQSHDGLAWRSSYESGQTEGADESVWSQVFSHMYQVLSDTDNIGEGLVDYTYDDVNADFTGGQVAMIRSSGGDVTQLNNAEGDYEYVLLPYFGETEDQNWVLTYPYFQAAMSATSSVDSELLMEIYQCLLGQECQDALKMESQGLSYTSEVTLERNEYLANLEPYIQNNHVFTRLANNKVFAGAMDAVQGMISGTYTAEQAYQAFDEALKAESTQPEADLNLKASYAYDFDDKHGSQSSSALLNSLRQQWGTDLAVSFSTSFSNSIYEGAMSSSNLKYYFAANYGSNYVMNLTGAQVKELLAVMLHYEADSSGMHAGMNPVSTAMLPVTSGFEYTCTESVGSDGVRQYALDSVTIDGKEISDDETYSFSFCVPPYYANYIAGLAGIDLSTDAVKDADTPIKTLKAYFESNDQFAEPTDYVKVNG